MTQEEKDATALTRDRAQDEESDDFSPEAIAARLQRSYLNFRWPLFLLNPEECTRPCLENGWSPLAMVAHVAFWDGFQLQRMQAALNAAGPVPSPPRSNDDRAENEDRCWEEVLAVADEARGNMIEFAASLTAGQIVADYVENGARRPVLKQLLNHMPRHADEHAQDVHSYCFSLQRWGREGVIRFYRRQFDNLLDCITGLSELDCVSIAVSGRWSVRDVLVHALVWDEYTWAIVRQWPEVDLTVLDPWISADDDAVNERLMAGKADMSMIDLLDRLVTVHRRIANRYRSLSDEQVQKEVAYNQVEKGNLIFLLISMSAHAADHAAEIYAARAQGRLRPLV
ncbi:MAG: DinB family protein [Caldilineaceae bacterium]|nr:DinB family protein [Caldilineaceae bacterium]